MDGGGSWSSGRYRYTYIYMARPQAHTPRHSVYARMRLLRPIYPNMQLHQLLLDALDHPGVRVVSIHVNTLLLGMVCAHLAHPASLAITTCHGMPFASVCRSSLPGAGVTYDRRYMNPIASRSVCTAGPIAGINY